MRVSCPPYQPPRLPREALPPPRRSPPRMPRGAACARGGSPKPGFSVQGWGFRVGGSGLGVQGWLGVGGGELGQTALLTALITCADPACWMSRDTTSRRPCPHAIWYGAKASVFWGSGVRVQGLVFRVQSSGFRVQGSGSRVPGFQGSGFQGSGSRVQVLEFRIQGSGFRVWDSGSRVPGLGFRVQGLGLRV